MTFPDLRAAPHWIAAQRQPRPKGRGLAASLLLLPILSGCSDDAAPPKYEVTGLITYEEKPVVYGDIFLEPKEGLVNVQSVTSSLIRDGRYTAKIVGGQHRVTVRDLTGDMELDPTNFGKKKAMLRKPYNGTIDFPPLEQATGNSPVEKNIEIPRNYR